MIAVPPAPTFRERGFTLTELAIVMFVVALMLGGMLLPLSAQQDVRARNETDRAINDAREALLGYVMVNDRFPCPASATSNGRASPESSGVCTHPYNGLFPAATLGFATASQDGYAYDGWGTDAVHRLRYAVTTINGSAFTTTSGIRNIGIGSVVGDLVVCASGTGITATDCGTASKLTDNAVLVIYSLGKNATTGGTSADEQANINGDKVFVSAAASGDYDDSLTWLSPNILVGRLVAAGRLP